MPSYSFGDILSGKSGVYSGSSGPMSTGPNQFYFPNQAGAFNPLPNQNAQVSWPGGGMSVKPGWNTSGGSVLGSQAPSNQTSGGGYSSSGYSAGYHGVGPPAMEQGPQGNQPSSFYDEMRGNINQGYNQYFAELDTVLSQGLPEQRTAQEGIVKSQYTGGVGELQGQKTQGEADLDVQRRKTGEQQVKPLKDLSADIRNQMVAGNVFLGARGAGDSSAANQYSYALTKLGSKQRGDVMGQTSSIMNDINDRQFKLGNIFNTEVNRLGSERDQKISSIASWFADAQNQIRQLKASGQISKAQDLNAISQNALQFAQQQLMMAQQEASNKRSALESWALSRSQDIQQLAQNMQGISGYQAPNLQRGPLTGQPQVSGGNINVPGY